MAFSETELSEHLETLESEFWTKRRPSPEIRDQLREGQRIDGHCIDLYFERPAYQRPGEFIDESIARIRYVRTRDLWALYWQRADLKFHLYEPCPEVSSLSEALAVIHKDGHGCFFG